MATHPAWCIDRETIPSESTTRALQAEEAWVHKK
jgi:hypothetical protein